ncbi:MAG TPA: NUDIX hydrolase [Kribbellaceae bacterium]|jgi:ADP-ribose pyrophosphatase YjhB (NUDIX family)
MTSPERWAYLAEGNAKQARKRVAAKVLLRDQSDRLLLVNPNYKSWWDLPGGMAEANEAPRAAAEREVREELGLHLVTGALLCVDWVAARGPWDDHLVFVFDGGVLTESQVDGLALADDELTGFEFVRADVAQQRLRPDVAERTDRALAAVAAGRTSYQQYDDPSHT